MPQQTQQYTLEREGDGRYLVRGDDGQRIGWVLGRAGCWQAERTDGTAISCFNTRADGARALVNANGGRKKTTSEMS